MAKLRLPAALAALCLTAAPAWADAPILSFGLSAAAVERDDNPLPGDPFAGVAEPNEDDSFSALMGDASATFHARDGMLRFQLDAHFEAYDASGAEPNNNNPDRSYQFDAQAGYVRGNWYAGGFLSSSRALFNEGDEEQDTDTFAYGITGAYHFEAWSVSGVLGGYVADSADDESLDDTIFIQLAADRFFNAGNTSLGGRIAYAEGDQDYESNNPSPTDVFEAGLVLEHALPAEVFGGRPSLFADLSTVIVEEDFDGDPNVEITENRLELGFRLTFGAASVQDRVRRTAPSLPNYTRWQVFVPVVDG